MKRWIAWLLCLLLCCGTLPVFAANEDQIFRISCSMYRDGATGRGFCWFTEQDGGSDLLLQKEGENTADAKHYSGTCRAYRKRYSHQVAVTDLEPGAAYRYRVGDAEKDLWSDWCTFRTDDKDDSFLFIAIADVQAGTMEKFLKAAKTLREAERTLPKSDFTVNLGDYVNDNTNEEWDNYFEAFSFNNETQTGVPVAGNHDGNFTNKFNTNCFKNMFCLDQSVNRSLEGVYYSFDYGNAHFTVLNTNDMYPMSQAQKNWLVNDVTTSSAMWNILLMHRSFYSAGKNINKPDTIIQRNMLLPLIDRLGIDLVLSGHDHMYLRTAPVKGEKRVENLTCITEPFRGEDVTFTVEPQGTVYAMPSTAGTKRYNVNENAMAPILDVADKAFSTKELGGCFATVEIDGGRLVYRAYTVDDETGARTLADTYALAKNAVTPRKATALDQSLLSTIAAWPGNLTVGLCGMCVSYLKLLVQVIAQAVR